MTEPSTIQVYTDGACTGNPGPGGWGAVLLRDGKKKRISGGEAYTTNNRMELTAALSALQIIDKPSQIALYTDSEYLKKGITEWLPGWKARNWKRKGGALANIDLWQALDQALQRHTVSWHWVRGHAGHLLNEEADRLARKAIPR
mgnify:FL=1